MADQSRHHFTRREREIMDIIYRRRQATAAEVMEDMHSSPSYSTVRALLRILVEKGHLRYEQQQEGQRYVFLPTVTGEKAKRSALKSLLEVFFNNSMEAAVVTLLDISHDHLTSDDWDRLSKLIERAKKGGTHELV